MSPSPPVHPPSSLSSLSSSLSSSSSSSLFSSSLSSSSSPSLYSSISAGILLSKGYLCEEKVTRGYSRFSGTTVHISGDSLGY